MRIISGEFRGKNILAPRHNFVRPTTDFAKQGLFNILNNHFDFSSVKVLDLFSGTGGISYEFVSRGCGDVTAIEKDPKLAYFIKETFIQLRSQAKAVKGDAIAYLSKCTEKFDIIFADPFYDFDNYAKIPETVFNRNLLNDNGWLIIEHSKNTAFKTTERFLEQREYGNVNFSIFK